MTDLDHPALRERYDRDGFVFLPALLPDDLLGRMRRELPRVIGEPGPQRFLEDDGVTVRAVYGLHRRGGVWAEAAMDSVVSRIARGLCDEDLYVFQWKINPKAAGTGDEWEWHRDFTFWHAEDGMPAPRAFTAAILLDDVGEDNGPLRLIPGSHAVTHLDEELSAIDGRKPTDRQGGDWSAIVSNRLSFAISEEGANELAAERGVFSACGPAGSVVFFHSNLVHGSSPNRSRSPRTLALITYNPLSNAPVGWATPRPDYFVNLEPAPLR